jgi:hypothetical protein
VIIPLVAAAAELAVPSQQSVASEPAQRDSAVAFIDARRGWLISGAHAGSAAAPRLGIGWRTVDGGGRLKIVLRSPLLAP